MSNDRLYWINEDPNVPIQRRYSNSRVGRMSLSPWELRNRYADIQLKKLMTGRMITRIMRKYGVPLGVEKKIRSYIYRKL